MHTSDFITVFGLHFAPWLFNGILVFAFSMILTGILIPKILLISLRKNLFDLPDERKIHHVAVPRLGGIAFMPAIILSLSFVTGINLVFNGGVEVTTNAINFDAEAIPFCFGLCALMMLYLVGIADDLIGVKYRAKFVVQIIAALLLVSSGISVTDLNGFFGLYELPVWLSTPLTVVLIVLIVNAVNLIDGIDGLASGLSAIALAFYAVVCISSKDYSYAMLALAALGTLIPFFYYNVFGNVKVGKKIFMGDTGALTTGLVLSFIAIKVSNINPANTSSDTSMTVLAFSPLVVPCLDVVRVFFHRLGRRQSPFLPGRTHIHHKLLALGIRQHVAMLTILAVSAAFTALNLMLSPRLNVDAIILLDLLIWVLGNLWLTRAIRRRQERLPETKEMYD